MAYTPEQRRLLQTKQIRVQVKKGTPLVSELLEGVPVIRSTDSGVYQYVRHNSSLYKVKLDRASDAEVEKIKAQRQAQQQQQAEMMQTMQEAKVAKDAAPMVQTLNEQTSK